VLAFLASLGFRCGIGASSIDHSEIHSIPIVETGRHVSAAGGRHNLSYPGKNGLQLSHPLKVPQNSSRSVRFSLSGTVEGGGGGGGKEARGKEAGQEQNNDSPRGQLPFSTPSGDMPTTVVNYQPQFHRSGETERGTQERDARREDYFDADAQEGKEGEGGSGNDDVEDLIILTSDDPKEEEEHDIVIEGSREQPKKNQHHTDSSVRRKRRRRRRKGIKGSSKHRKGTNQLHQGGRENGFGLPHEIHHHQLERILPRDEVEGAGDDDFGLREMQKADEEINFELDRIGTIDAAKTTRMLRPDGKTELSTHKNHRGGASAARGREKLQRELQDAEENVQEEQQQHLLHASSSTSSAPLLMSSRTDSSVGGSELSVPPVPKNPLETITDTSQWGKYALIFAIVIVVVVFCIVAVRYLPEVIYGIETCCYYSFRALYWPMYGLLLCAQHSCYPLKEAAVYSYRKCLYQCKPYLLTSR